MANRVDAFFNRVTEDAALRFYEALESATSKSESPIERLLMAALYAQAQIELTNVVFFLGDFPDIPPIEGSACVYSQARIGKYRADIAIWDSTGNSPRVMIVECDGHDYHERTKEQARKDKARDRYFQSLGHKVLRFTGSEIWECPETCAEEVFAQLACEDEWRKART
jgi:very-short-patch-repair endonuclease